jgi:N-acetylneuraminic acid mutarotase
MKILKTTSLLLFILITSCSTETEVGWKEIKSTNTPSVRYDSCYFYQTTTNSFYIVGGRNSQNQSYNDIWKLDISKGSWSQKPTPSGASLDSVGRMNYCAFDKDNDLLYLYGKNSSGNTLPSEILKWAVNDNILEEIAPSSVPDTSRGHSIILLKSGLSEPSLVIFGGEDTGSVKNNDIKTFSLSSKKFETLNISGIKPPERTNHIAVLSKNNKMIVIGGESNSGSLKDIWSFDFTTKSWTEINSVNSKIDGYYNSHFYSDSDNSIIFYGGKNSTGKFLSNFIKYDITNNTWEELDSNPQPSELSGSAIISPSKGKFYLFGGNSMNSNQEPVSTNKTWKYSY